MRALCTREGSSHAPITQTIGSSDQGFAQPDLASVEPDEQPQKWMIRFQGGPWNGHMMIMEGEPKQVIDTSDDPPFDTG
jgi:hypothetical protein